MDTGTSQDLCVGYCGTTDSRLNGATSLLISKVCYIFNHQFLRQPGVSVKGMTGDD